MGQFDENGNPILYQEDVEGLELEEDQIVITQPEDIANQENLTQINLEGETQYIFKPVSYTHLRAHET